MHALYTTLVYNPLYNGFILLIDAVRFIPWLDVGMVVILFTVIVRLILFPLSRKAARTQVVMRQAEPELAAIKEKYKNDRQALAVQTMAFYKEKKINPFSMFFLLIIQLPILIALYHIFYTSGLSTIHTDILYSFVSIPPAIGTHFLGLFDLTQKSFFLALLAAGSQYFQIHISTPKARRDGEGRLTQESMMHMMMKFIMPIMIFLISSSIASALAIYWTTSNLFMIGQELYVRRQISKEKLS
ncbi:MAG TPA: YidC/Oxa1 family membrane protein insertase [Candidatus Paceibacterota bacterium]|nr:YidC/Oxa1 family membrane protein insertase [Candidatus Paceibacterota bacterium]